MTQFKNVSFHFQPAVKLTEPFQSPIASLNAFGKMGHAPQAIAEDSTDGFSYEFEQWRFNLRKSNTEPLVRLNVETRGDEALLKEKTQEILRVLDGSG